MAVIATGFFDGVHLGHRRLIESLVQCAKDHAEPGIVMTFWPHPRMVLQKDARKLRLLSTVQEKERRLKALGVDRIEVLPFTRKFASLTAEKYLKDVLLTRYPGCKLILGYDNRLGSDQLSPQETLALASSLGINAIMCDAYGDISSTKIRKAMSEGRIEFANQCLGYDYSLRGVVVEGKQLGRTIGYPTANMQMYDPLKVVPKCGAYLTKVRVLDREFYGMTNVGPVIETHIFDFDDDIYGLDIELTFESFIRDEMKFSSVEELKNQLRIDEMSAKNHIFGI
ncbi:MAG: riboflavin biosynthesis protein RibF [Bacteroidales bacterium]|nr:riboflavin biosynthesis protein RibF [Bacteroidales bacterium]